jgi:3-oxoacyl-[acyl-carrier protein] reductase
MDLGLQGRVAVVTGGSRGIGRAIAQAFVSEGANVAICARGQDGLDRALAELRGGGATAFGQVADVTAHASIDAFIDASAEALGGIDILINNVGGSRGKGLLGSTDEEWVGTFDLNLFHAVRTARAAVPHMRKRGGGSIVTISSISGYKAAPGSQYGCAKAAENFLSGALAMELGPDRIRANTVCPGSILFPGGGWAGYQESDPQGFGRFETEEFPLGRLGTPEEVARAVVFVASPAGGWINGALIPVDGGQQQPTVIQKGPVWR